MSFAMLPPSYLAAKARPVAAVDAFRTARDQADCRNGGRIGAQLGTSFIELLNPSCEDLLNPLGDEWSAPVPSSPKSSTFMRCSDTAGSRRVSEHVYATAQSCASDILASTLTAAQVAYRKCYLDIASAVSPATATFAPDLWAPSRWTLVPRDDSRWDATVRSLRSMYGQQSGIIRQACEISKADAQSALAPRAFLQTCTD